MKEIVKIFLCLLLIQSTASALDTDNDGMPDDWEVQYGLNTSADDSASDLDNDTLTNLEEYNISTNPTLADTDNDGLSDNLEQASFEMGTEFRINTYTISTQATPCVASNGTDYIVAWDSYGQDGSYGGIYAQRYDAELQPLSLEFRINTHTANWQAVPEISSDGFVYFAAWGSKNQDGGYYGVYGQRITLDGVKLGSEFRVNEYTPDAQLYATIANNTDSFFVTWSSDTQDGDAYGIYGRLFDSSGNTLVNEMKISQVSAGNQEYQKIASNGSNYFIVWESEEQDGNGYGIYGRVYNSTGTPINNEFQVNDYTVGDQNRPAIAGDDNRYLVVWSSAGQDGSGAGIYGRFFDAQGNSLGEEFLINQYTTDDQLNPEVVFDGGAYVVVWESDAQDGDDIGIYGRVLNTSGSFLQDEFKVNDYTQGIQFRHAISSNGDSSFVVWEGNGLSDSYGVYGKSIVVGLGTDPTNADTDNDGIPDGWEVDHNMNPTYDDSSSDQDGDGLFDPQEYLLGTEMTNPDTDNDGLCDGDEITAGTSLLDSDSDNDTLLDGWEVLHGFNPLVDDSQLDSDNDGLNNLSEYTHNTNPLISDTDNDGLTDGEEVLTYQTLPDNPDTDGDGLLDGAELDLGFNPLVDDSAVDSDNDGLSDVQEYRQGTNRFDADTDNDGLNDYIESTSIMDTERVEVETLITNGRKASSESTSLRVWEDDDEDEYGIFGQLYDLAGNAIGTSFQINTYTAGNQGLVQIASNGQSYFVVWENGPDSGSEFEVDIAGRLFDASGNAIGDEFQVNSYTTDIQNYPSVGSDGSSYLVAWTTHIGNDFSHIVAQLFDESGNKIGNEFQLDSFTTADQYIPFVASNGNSYFVTWESRGQDDSSAIFGQRLDLSGNIVGAEMQIDADTTNFLYQAVSISNGSGYLTTWRIMNLSIYADEIYGKNIYFFDPNNPDSDNDGIPDGWEFENILEPYQDDSQIDSDNDGLTNTEEYNLNTLVYNPDSDNDGIPDYTEISSGTDPLEIDSDNDGMPDGWEVLHGFNPLVDDSQLDSDNDGLNNASEYAHNSDPFIADTDNDGLSDGEEVFIVDMEEEISINTSVLNTRSFPEIASDGNAYFVTWVGDAQGDSGYDLYGQLFDQAGARIGNEMLVNTEYGSIASNGNTYFLTWSINDEYGASERYGQLFDLSGNKIGTEIHINTYADAIQGGSSIASNGTTYFATWTRYEDAVFSSNCDIYGQMFDASGNKIGTELTINSYTTSTQERPSIASNGTTYFVAWHGRGQDGSNCVYGQMFDASGNKIGTEITINTDIGVSTSFPSVASDGNSYFVTWDGYGTLYDIRGQIIDATGNKIGTEFIVNTWTASDRYSPAVASDGSSYLVVWGGIEHDGLYDDIYAQFFDSMGNKLGAEFTVNMNTLGHQSTASVASNDNSYFIVWSNDGLGGFDYGVSGRRILTASCDPANPDTDGDDMPDGWELQYGFDSTINQRYVDSDNDGMFNGQECRYTSNPFSADSDNDGLTDYQELFFYELTDSFVITTYTETVSSGGGNDSSGVVIIYDPGYGYSDGNLFDSYDEVGNVWEWSDSGALFIRAGFVSDGDLIGSPVLDGNVVGFRVAQLVEYDNPELGLSTVPQTHYLTSVRATNGSSYFMVWGEDNEVIGQVLDSSFEDVSGEFRVNSYTTSTQSNPFAASDGENYLVVWQSDGQDGADEGVFAALYDDQATLLMSDTQINSYTPNAQSAPIAASDGDSYFVVWSSYAQDGSLTGVYGRLFDTQLSPMTGEFRINNSTVYDQRYPSMASNGATYLVAWTTNPDGDDAYYNYGRFYNPDGTPLGDEFPISSLGAYSSPVVSANGTIYCVIWMTENQTSGEVDLYARFYDKFGYTIGDEVKLNDDPLETWSVCTIINNGDVFLVKWSAYDETGTEKTIFGKYITFTGADPNDPDTDNDSLTDYDEVTLYGTSASNSDTDGDTFADNWELSNGLNPLVDESMDDVDNDGLTTLEEYELGTDFFNPDSDNDGLSDGDEILIFEMGEEIQINTYTTNPQYHPSVCSNGIGYLVTWSGYGASGSYDDIYGRMLDVSGSPIGAEFCINSYTTSYQYYPSVCSNGISYLVTWRGYGTSDSSYDDIYGRMLDASGSPIGADFCINSYTPYYQYYPSVCSNGASYLVTWFGYGAPDSSYDDIYGQMLDASGSPIGSEFRVNSYTTSYQNWPSVCSNGVSYLITWSGYGASGSSYGIYGQMLDASGNLIGSEFRVNTYTSSDQKYPSVCSNGTGYLVTWSGYGASGSSYDIYGQMLDASGNLIGSEFRVNTYTSSDQNYPSVCSNGFSYLITWSGYGASGSSYDIYGQMLDTSGSPIGSEFRVNTYTSNDQEGVTIASNGNSYFAVWENYGQDASLVDVSGRELVVIFSDPTNADTDNDGMPDGWEVDHHLNPAYDDSDFDGDGDGLNALGEYIAGTDMTNPDSDNDGINDGDEVDMGANPTDSDSDNDGMPDGWEVANNLNPVFNDANDDADTELLSNLDEFLNNSNPNVSDTDTDGITDYDEVYQYFTSPALADTDGDGLDDPSELFDYQTDVLNPDTDGDRINDADEIAGSTDPLVADVTYELHRQSTHYSVQPENSNSSVFSKSMHYDIFAQISKTTSSVVFGSVNMSIAVWFDGFVNLNSDSDRMPDWWERFYGLQVLSDDADSDPDTDTIVNLEEYLMDMNPINADTDGDGLPDAWELIYGTDPLYPDSSLDYDGDLLTNIAEKNFGTDPMNPDTDGDRVLDGQEILSGRDPAVAENTFEQSRQSARYRLDNEILNSSGTELSTSDTYEHMSSTMIWYAPLLVESMSYNLETGLIVLLATDSDNDGMWDSWELFYGTDPYADDSDNDSDGDSLTNLMEFRFGSNPLDYDTDNDGQSDWMEQYAGTNPSDAQSVFRAWITASIDNGRHTVLEWSSNADKIYSLYIKDNIHEDFVLYKQSIPGLSDITSFIDMGLDVNNNGSYTDESDIAPPGDESIKQRLYKVIIE